MRIGILPNLHPFAGGIYQYSLAILRALCESKSHGYEDEFTIFADKLPPHLMSPNGVKWKLAPPEPSSLRQQALEGLARIVGEGPHREAWRWARRRLGQISRPPAPLRPPPDRVLFRHDMKRWLRQCGIELMLCAWPNRSSFEAEVPYVMAIHDLQHRLQPEFPEVSANGEWEMREYTFRNGCRYATLLLADSEVGKEDILNFYGCYGVTDDRVKVLPFLPATYLDGDISEVERQRVRSKYRLPDRFLFYPAQFWPHKNQGRIVQALGLLKQTCKVDIPIVFCGSHSGKIREASFSHAMTLSADLKLENEVQYIGYAPDEEMSVLYSDAVALVMPTFFGPTNIPVLEAWAMGCPVLTSDIRGIREQAGDAAVLVDPSSVEALADGIYRLWTDDNLRRTLATAGRLRLASYSATDFANRLINILEEAKDRVRDSKTKSQR